MGGGAGKTTMRSRHTLRLMPPGLRGQPPHITIGTPKAAAAAAKAAANALRASDLMREVARFRGSVETVLEWSPTRDSASNGAAEKGVQKIQFNQNHNGHFSTADVQFVLTVGSYM